MTRKIEQQILAAIREGRFWQSGSTCVMFNAERNVCTVYLHGNRIAVYSAGNDARARLMNIKDVAAIRDTFRRFPTATTRSRLRALGIDASIKRGVAMIDERPA